jgi:hypothetical protein
MPEWQELAEWIMQVFRFKFKQNDRGITRVKARDGPRKEICNEPKAVGTTMPKKKREIN